MKRIKDINFKLGLIVALLAAGLYANTIGNGFVYDDNNITDNYLVRQGFAGVPEIFKSSYRYGSWSGVKEDDLYRPLTVTLFAVTWQFFPDNPMPGHIINIVLYALTGFFLFAFLRKILSGYHIIIPFIASLVFIAHPIHTEVVANIKSADEILSFLFSLFAFLFALRYMEDKQVLVKINDGSGTNVLLLRPIFNAFLLSLCFLLSLLSKEGSITMLLVIPLTLYFFKKVPARKLISILILLLIPVALYFMLRSAAEGGITEEKHHLFIDNIFANTDIGTRLATAFYLLMRYIKLMLFPHPLVCDYSYKASEIVTWSNPIAVISLLFHAALLWYALKAIRRKSIFSYAILFYLITIFLYSNIFFLIGSHFAERFLYVPLLGFCVAAAVLFCKLFKINYRAQLSPSAGWMDIKNRRVVFISIFLLFISYSIKTIARNQSWKDEFTLFTEDAKTSPSSARLAALKADIIMHDKVKILTDSAEKTLWLENAIAEYQRATEIYPDYADAYGQWGYAYILKGDDENAADKLIKAIDLKSHMENVYNNLGTIYFKIEEYKDALDLFKYSVELNPRFVDGWFNIATSYKVMKQYDKAIEAYSTVLNLAPGDANIYLSLNNVYLAKGDSVNARINLENAYRLDPSLKK